MVEAPKTDTPSRFQQAIEQIDSYNKQDPHDREYDYSRAVTAWVLTLQPNASEAVRLAARAQHIGRWQIPRNTYPAGRSGYLRWRRDLAQFHAQKAADILQRCGYEQGTIDRVKSIMTKKQLKADEETQTLEDALCLVFMERQLEDFRNRVDEEKLANIMRKTWKKMSEQGREAAMNLSLPAPTKEFLKRVLQ